jgi:hypothetical protein
MVRLHEPPIYVADSQGSPVRIAPDVVATDDPVIQRHMAAPRSPWRKGRWFKGMKFDPRLDNLLSMADEEAHTKLRAKLMPGVCIAVRTADARLTDA